MGVVATFDYTTWVAQFPQYTTAPSQAAVEALVPIAEIYWRNDGGGPVCKAALQSTILNLIVAHIVYLTYGPNGSTPGGSGIVGRISNASEGSVSVAAEYPTNPNNAWFLQTPFGAMFWQATTQFRRARYLANPVKVGPVVGPNGVLVGTGYWGGGWGYGGPQN